MTSDADRIIGLYDRNAEDWARRSARRRFFEQAWIDRFLALVPASGSILDLGCGSGEPIAVYLIERGYRVTGVDSSPALLKLCKDRFPEQTWIAADMRALDLGTRFDGVLAWNSFFHLAHGPQRGMFPIFAKHSRNGTPLMFTSGTAFGEAIGTYQDEPLYHASLETAEYRALLAKNGFTVVSHAVEDETCGGHTIWLARHGGDPQGKS